MEKIVVLKQDFLYFQIANFLIEEQNYKLIYASDSKRNLYFKNIEQDSYIRLVRKDLIWTRDLKEDIEKEEETLRNSTVYRLSKKAKCTYLYISDVNPFFDFYYIFSTITEENITGNLFSPADVMEEEELACGKKFSPLVDEESAFNFIEDVEQKIQSIEQEREKTIQRTFFYGKPIFSSVFLFIQILFFFWLEFNGGSQNVETLIKYGAKHNELLLEGEWWRLITPIFLHIGLLHLLMNSIALYYVGTVVERIYGSSRFLLIYLIAGVSGTIGSFLFSPTVSAGASGAIFGCFGALLFFGYKSPKIFFDTLGTNVIMLVLFNIVFGFVVPGIDNAGHLGGLIGGFVAAGAVQLPKKQSKLASLVYIVILIIGIGSSLFYGYNYKS
ncbi:rhomboid family intramembrane serine protease [Priestia endophytica]|uniref:rhomboid family intramembrane serine protease n=1 Tax=Priestia endophytica TaxID=135735 RepID=UPI002E1D9A2B|nr:rhomboid family intramembrane serine protease [Priestia endophytica]